MNKKEWLKKIPPKHGYYIAGFVDGEGSFNVSTKKQDTYRDGWRIIASFNVSQRDRIILAFIKKMLGCGTLRERKDGVVYYEVTNIKSLREKVIPFFKFFGFISSSKKKNFSVFCQIVDLMSENAHLSKDGRKQILNLRERLNEGRGRKRKYNQKEIN